jgi:cytochrome c5
MTFMHKKLLPLTLPVLAVLSLAAMGSAMSCAETGAALKTTADAADEKTGMQIWSENCNTCHNSRSPGTYSATQWEPVMMHMRTVANLTGKDARKVKEYLQTR